MPLLHIFLYISVAAELLVRQGTDIGLLEALVHSFFTWVGHTLAHDIVFGKCQKVAKLRHFKLKGAY
jgi:hypothetical protein